MHFNCTLTILENQSFMNFLTTLYAHLILLLIYLFYDNAQATVIIKQKTKHTRVMTNDEAGGMLEMILASLKVLLNICLERLKSIKLSLRTARFWA
jgi:hypothetical protein